MPKYATNNKRLKTIMTTSDLEFVKSFCDRFVPCKVELDYVAQKHTKVPAIAKWTSITPDQSKNIELIPKYGNWKHFMFVTGDST